MLTTLSISNQEIKLAAIKGKKVKCWTSRTLESGIVRDGRVLEPQRLGETLTQLFKAQKLSKNKVVVTLSGMPYSYRIIEFPLLKETQVGEAILRTVPEEFTIPLEDLYISWARLITKAEGADYFVLGVDRDLVDAFVQTMKIAGIKDWTMDLRPLALARAVGATDAIVAALDLDHLDIVLVRDGYIKELHSAVLDHDGRPAKFNRYAEQFVSELVKILSYHHDDAGAAKPDNALADLPILLTGELIAPAGADRETPDENQVISMLTKLTGHGVSLIHPPIAGPAAFNANAYATNIGLYLKTRNRKPATDIATDHFHDVNVDILSGGYAKKPVVVPMWYTVAPVIVFLLVFGAWTFNSAASENNEQVRVLNAEMTELTAARADIEKKVAQQTKLEQEFKAAGETLQQLKADHQGLLAGKGKSTGYVDDARSSLPAGADLKSIRISDKEVKLEGTVASEFDVITYIKSLEAAGYTVNLHDINNETEGDFSFNIALKIAPAD
jgi:Tfp pilus assembly PilM family ATPase/Tfp pilus assembly protein PilN